MTSENYTVERMLETRVARRNELTAFPESFVDTVIPRYRRKLHSIIGKSVFEDPAMQPAITVRHPFSFSLIEVGPGNGAGLHSHTTEEVFMPIDGKLAVFSGVREYPVRVKCATLPWHTVRAAAHGEAATVKTE